MANVMAPRSTILFYVWALEQPYGEFGSQDVLVPWNMHEIPMNGNLPMIRFHKHSTKEQRIIAVRIDVNEDILVFRIPFRLRSIADSQIKFLHIYSNLLTTNSCVFKNSYHRRFHNLLVKNGTKV
jgi:hypothetical protein